MLRGARDFQFGHCQFGHGRVGHFSIRTCSIFKFPVSKFPASQFTSFKFSKRQVLHLSSLTFTNCEYQSSNFKHFKNVSLNKFEKLRTQTFRQFQNFIFSYMKIIFQGCSHNFLCFLKYVGDNYEVRTTFGHISGRSKNVLKSIAIDQESLISHFGINKTPLNPHNYIKKQRNIKNAFFLLYFEPYRPRF